MPAIDAITITVVLLAVFSLILGIAGLIVDLVCRFLDRNKPEEF